MEGGSDVGEVDIEFERPSSTRQTGILKQAFNIIGTTTHRELTQKVSLILRHNSHSVVTKTNSVYKISTVGILTN